MAKTLTDDPATREIVTNILSNIASGTIGGVVGGESGAASASTMDRYNRQLHQNEKDRLRELADGDDEMLERLWSVACAKVECYAEFSEGSELYVKYKIIADKAYGDGYQAEWDLLADQKYFVPNQGAQQMWGPGHYESLFTYTGADKAADYLTLLDNIYQIGVRTGGAIQYVSGSVMVGISGGTAVVTSELGVGVLAIGGVVYYWDQANAGYLTMIHGEFHETAFVEILQTKLGMSAEDAHMLDALVGLTGGAGIAKGFNTAAKGIATLSVTEQSVHANLDIS